MCSFAGQLNVYASPTDTPGASQQALATFEEAEARVVAKQHQLERAREILASAREVAQEAHDLVTKADAMTAAFGRWTATAKSYPNVLSVCGATIEPLFTANEALTVSDGRLRGTSHDAPSTAEAAKAVDGELTRFYGLNESSKSSFAIAANAGADCEKRHEEQLRISSQVIMGSWTGDVMHWADVLTDDLATLATETSLFQGGSDLPAPLIQKFGAELELRDHVLARSVPFASRRELSAGTQFLYRETEELLVTLRDDLRDYQQAAAGAIAENAAADY